MLVDRSKQQSNLLCPMCGSNSFSWGLIREHSRLEFVPGENFWEKLKNLGGKKVRCRCCNDCGNLQLFV